MAVTYESSLLSAPEQERAPAIEIDFSEDLTSEQRKIARRSVERMAAAGVEAREQQRAVEAGYQELSDAINAPLRKAVEADEAGRRKFEHLRDHTPLRFDEPTLLEAGAEYPVAVEAADMHIHDVRATQVFSPPYHFDWRWHNTGGSAPYTSSTNRPLGQASLQGRCGPWIPGAGGKFVEAHAGFGLLFRPTVNGLLSGDSLRVLGFFWVVGAFGIGSNATVEGGTECTILEDGKLKAVNSHKLWRKRVSVNEWADFVQTNPVTDTSMRTQFPMRAGHEYTFNVGFWIYADNTAGVGTSGAISALGGRVPSMVVTQP
ncbi:hypothetical protein [Streptomyces sp. NPDC053431]|uniref:hypothetical protein n=1 Tax=Streptomyces sp. NPDC053431 TaxID=3365703 RepID=UPI0037D7168C